MRVNPNSVQTANYTVLQRQNAAQNAYRVMNRADASAQRKVADAQAKPTPAQTRPTAPITPVAAPQTNAATTPAIEAIQNLPLLTRTQTPAAPTDASLQTYGDLHLNAVKNAFGAAKGDERYNAVADANSDGVVDFNDTTHVLSNWGKQVTGGTEAPAVYNEDYLALVQQNMGTKAGEDRFSPASDANADGVVDFNDVIHVLTNWGKPITPRDDSGA